ncbi:MAG: hypothetical protein HYW51_03895 [Candidatus Doudnabacteria bacterium]|nr:hypothetical protein [Candidatus Doudnabacteria bacterium]
MKRLLLVLALTVGAMQAPVGQEQTPEPNRIKRVPEDTRDWVNAYFPPEVMEVLWLTDYAALDQAYENGWLVDIPQNSDPLAEALGIRLQTEGDFPIAEAEPDPKLKVKLFRLAKPGAGLLYSIADHVREEERKERERRKLQPRPFLPIGVTSLVRTAEYQARLIPLNANADTESQGVPATHITGLVTDITRANMTTARDRIVSNYLIELRDADKILYFREGAKQATYHVIALLQTREFFEAEYDRLLLKARERMAAEAQGTIEKPND